MTHTLVFDIGKTHAKAVVFDAMLAAVARVQRANVILDAPPYPHLDVDGMWRWMIEAMRDAARRFQVGRIVVTTHGAAAALIDPSRGEDGLRLPVLDYEFDGPAQLDDYAALRPAFALSYSPALPQGLNLGRQLHWLRSCFPDLCERAQTVLLYPQYWSWRLSGALASEYSSLGCHTDLWLPVTREFSTLVPALGLQGKFPAVRPAWAPAAGLRAELAALTGLPADCVIYTGVHDSNAGFARYLRHMRGAPFVLVSTGTWVVCMASGGSLSVLDPARDMLANVDVNGDAIPCARFMGGREYASICGRLGADVAHYVTVADIQSVVDIGAMALPDFSGGSGPFGGQVGRIVGHPENGTALATLYVALMIDYQLDLLAAPGEIIIEGAFLTNAALCGLVAALRGMAVHLSDAPDASALGAAMLGHWEEQAAREPSLALCEPCVLRGLEVYRARWREAAAGISYAPERSGANAGARG